ncbi:hypothetical protein GCM10011611_18110 [Aliidongia dinghuensis]|uniref:Uncharacterized protein n=1 Tax=Aliidongia dinghuensis TaxID=1867774 RepID=A0A8J3E2S7_9PROT|nr:hypothetical protein GCM10011611_18110 [Aliidongia dinghuensis]
MADDAIAAKRLMKGRPAARGLTPTLWRTGENLYRASPSHEICEQRPAVRNILEAEARYGAAFEDLPAFA